MLGLFSAAAAIDDLIERLHCQVTIFFLDLLQLVFMKEILVSG